jgi:hypothetical protein
MLNPQYQFAISVVNSRVCDLGRLTDSNHRADDEKAEVDRRVR